MERILVLGIGNYLMGDEGVGVHFIKYLETQPLPDCIDIMDGGTGGFYLTHYIEGYSQVILVDATLDDKGPGSIKLLEPKFAKDYPRAMSTHDIGMKDLIESMMLMGTLPKIHLFAISIASLQQQCVDLSPEVEAILPELKNQVLELINQIKP